MTPLQAFSGQIPALESLITFGAKITAKKPGTRPTTLNPWAHDGIFLGYQNTMHNIKYWDINTGSIKTAKHEIQRMKYNTEITHTTGHQLQSI
jgi:hypothetical protein